MEASGSPGRLAGVRRLAPRVAVVLAVAAAGALLAWLVAGGGGEAEAAQKVQFLPAAEPQANPFTRPADVVRRRPKRAGPFGGSGSDRVCDRELLIALLRQRPERLREWARVLGVSPRTPAAVERYIRSLTPATLVRDTRVTNHSYVDGRARPFQAILASGTAILVDRQGRIRVRCQCGNPLLDPVLFAREECVNCRPNYRQPKTWQLATAYFRLERTDKAGRPTPTGSQASPLPLDPQQSGAPPDAGEPSDPDASPSDREPSPRGSPGTATATVTVTEQAPAGTKTVTEVVTQVQTVPVVRVVTVTETVTVTVRQPSGPG